MKIFREANAKRLIAKYIEEHGVEPSNIDQFYTITNEQYERHKRKLYACLMVLSNDSSHGSGDEQSDDPDDDVDSPEIDYSSIPFTIEALSEGEISWTLRQNQQLRYSKNGGNWETMNSATTITVVGGDVVSFKGNNMTYGGSNIVSSARFNVQGNIMSLTNGDYYNQVFSFQSDYWTGAEYDVFNSLFFRCSTLISAKNLVLPATTLCHWCYRSMFQECTNLVEAPELLPATALSEYCYAWMFCGCENLVTVPELPATELAERCYNGMFMNCTSLEDAPELPALSLTDYCYVNMFSGCENLKYVKAMFLSTPNGGNIAGWLDNVSATGTFIKNTCATWDNINADIPSGWTVQLIESTTKWGEDIQDDELWYGSEGVMTMDNQHLLSHSAIAAISQTGVLVTSVTYVDGTNVLTFDGSLTEIPEMTFVDCPDLLKIAIPDSVTKIGDSAFLGDENLTTVVLPSGLLEIGNGVFKNCNKLLHVLYQGVEYYNQTDLVSALETNNVSIGNLEWSK